MCSKFAQFCARRFTLGYNGDAGLSLNVGVGYRLPNAAMMINALEEKPKYFTGIVGAARGKLRKSVIESFLEIAIKMRDNIFYLHLSHGYPP